MDDTEEYKEFSIGSECDTSAEIAKVTIILGYATTRSKEETGKNNRVIFLCLGETSSGIHKWDTKQIWWIVARGLEKMAE